MTVSRNHVLKFIILVFVAAIVLLGYGGYKYFFSDMNSEYKLAAIRDIKEITELIDIGIKELKTDEVQTEVKTEEKTATGNDTQVQKPSEEPTLPAVPDQNKINDIKSVYENGLTQLQQQGNAMVDGLLSGVKSEYAALKKSGAGKSAILDLALSYMGKASAMEKEIDAGFNGIVSALSAELASLQMPKAEISIYIAEIKAAYKKQKDQRRNTILEKAKSYL